MKNNSIGVLVGRFQVHQLHEGHKQLIDSIVEKHHKVIIFIGISEALVTKNNPMDFITRKQMILNDYPEVTVLPIKDTALDTVWSLTLDKKIKEVHPFGDVILYGSRDSFISHYTGAFQTVEQEQKHFISGTQIRQNLSDTVIGSSDFRAGVIYAAYNQYPKVFPTVDILIYRNNEILLGKKPNEDKWRLIGGFTDPTDTSFEMAAKRETLEETGLEIDELTYVGSWKVSDWRYRSEEDKIMTTLFLGKYVFGRPTPKDDIAELRWVHVDQIDTVEIVPGHKMMVDFTIDKYFKNKVIN